MYIKESNFNQLLNDYNIISYILKNICLLIAIDKFCQGSFLYAYYYLIKHSQFTQKIEKDFSKYALEIFQSEENNLQIEKNEDFQNNWAEKHKIELYGLFGSIYYYGISNIINYIN